MKLTELQLEQIRNQIRRVKKCGTLQECESRRYKNSAGF